MKNPFVFTVNERNAATSNKTKKCDSPSREARVLFISTQLNLLPFKYSSYGCVHRRKQFCACVAMMRARAGAGDRCLQPYATSSSWVSTIEKCDRAINFLRDSTDGVVGAGLKTRVTQYNCYSTRASLTLQLLSISKRFHPRSLAPAADSTRKMPNCDTCLVANTRPR
jgi:hypothetical protein